jgi:hypothetical protein
VPIVVKRDFESVSQAVRSTLQYYWRVSDVRIEQNGQLTAQLRHHRSGL